MRSWAQAGQDRWVVETLGLGPGWFVDVGAYDGISTSNTYALEQAGWLGLCIEPGPSFEALKVNRRCAVARLAASNVNGACRLEGDHIVIDPAGDIPLNRLDYLLDAFHVSPVVDYLSIDVEGHELEVLDGMDFDRWTVRAITIEHNSYRDGPTLKDAIHERLSALGFERAVNDAECIDPCPPPAYPGAPFEDWFVHPSILR